MPWCPAASKWRAWFRRPATLFFLQLAIASSISSRFKSIFFRDKGCSDSAVGLMYGMEALGFLSVPAWTLAADRFGKLPFLLLGTAVPTLAFLLFALVPHGCALSAMLPVQLLYSLSYSGVSPILDALCLEKVCGDALRDAQASGADPALAVAAARGGYGKERLWGAVSWALFHLPLGLLIDAHGTMTLYPAAAATSVMFCIFVVCWQREQTRWQRQCDSVLLHPVAVASDDDAVAGAAGVERPSEAGALPSHDPLAGMCARLWRVVRSGQVVSLLLVILVLNAGMSLVEGLSFLYFQEGLRASNFICGAFVTVTVLFEIPIFCYSSQLLEKVTKTQLVAIAHLSYTVRVVFYTIAPDPVWVLLVEPLHGVTFATYAIFSVEMMACMAPAGLEASAQGLRTVFASLGSLLGYLIGGYVMQHLGDAILYRGAAVVVTVSLAAYLLAARLLRRGIQTGGQDGNHVAAPELVSDSQSPPVAQDCTADDQAVGSEG